MNQISNEAGKTPELTWVDDGALHIAMLKGIPIGHVGRHDFRTQSAPDAFMVFLYHSAGPMGQRNADSDAVGSVDAGKARLLVMVEDALANATASDALSAIDRQHWEFRLPDSLTGVLETIRENGGYAALSNGMYLFQSGHFACNVTQMNELRRLGFVAKARAEQRYTVYRLTTKAEEYLRSKQMEANLKLVPLASLAATQEALSQKLQHAEFVGEQRDALLASLRELLPFAVEAERAAKERRGLISPLADCEAKLQRARKAIALGEQASASV